MGFSSNLVLPCYRGGEFAAREQEGTAFESAVPIGRNLNRV